MGATCTLLARRAAYSFTVPHSFNYFDGANPYAGLIQDSAGTLYGTTSSGGAGAV